jgi:signal transduction histidine kinase
MGTRNLEARLTAPLLGLTGALIVLVGAASVVVTQRMLDASDSDVAHSHARNALHALETEIAEGDAIDQAAQEVVLAAQHEGARVQMHTPGRVSGDSSLPEVPPGGCVTVVRERGEPWRVCAVARGANVVVAGVSIAAHRAAVIALERGMAGVVGVALVLVWLAIRHAVRQPVAELAAVVAWTGRILDAESPIVPPAAATTEVAQLETAFDALVKRLLDVLARERASSAHIAHELRTPLTAIATELEAARGADEPSNAALGRVRTDIARFADVIDAILVLSAAPRATEGGARRTDPIVNVADIARELAPPGAAVEAPDEALVEADEHLVRLAVRNLVDNASKYGGGARKIRVSRSDGALRMAVVDEGPGVERHARDRMFERYWRGMADGDGRGLGLALVRAVAERHGGGARAEPGDAGRGLCVSLTLGPLLEWRDTQ